jgi:hypothetical protein
VKSACLFSLVAQQVTCQYDCFGNHVSTCFCDLFARAGMSVLDSRMLVTDMLLRPELWPVLSDASESALDLSFSSPAEPGPRNFRAPTIEGCTVRSPVETHLLNPLTQSEHRRQHPSQEKAEGLAKEEARSTTPGLCAHHCTTANDRPARSMIRGRQ